MSWNLDALKDWVWLPARRNREKWFKPNELYADNEAHLFESQARFLGIPTAMRDEISKLLATLGIKSTPSEGQVVRHLLHCAKQNTKVNIKVFDWLNARTSSAELDQLLGQPCILLSDSTYVRPTHVFWQPHPFGRFRCQLGADSRKYDALFRRLKVSETPVASDAIAVLCEIAAELGSVKQKIDEPTRFVILDCWKFLESALGSAQITPTDLSCLRRAKTVCVSDGTLESPERVIFDDRSGLVAKFVGFPRKNFIVRPQGAWRAIEAAGARRLSRMIDPHLVEAVDPIPNEQILRHLQDFKYPLERVLDVHKSESSDPSKVMQNLNLLDRLNYIEVRQLVVKYTIEVFSFTYESVPEPEKAMFLPKENTLYFALSRGDQQPPWPAIARELAAVLAPDNEPGALSCQINTVLAADSVEEANARLQELGIADLEFQEHDAPVSSSPVVQDLGGETLPSDEQSDESDSVDTESQQTQQADQISQSSATSRKRGFMETENRISLASPRF